MKSSPLPLKVHCTVPSSLRISAEPLALPVVRALVEAPLPRPAPLPWDAPRLPLAPADLEQHMQACSAYNSCMMHLSPTMLPEAKARQTGDSGFSH